MKHFFLFIIILLCISNITQANLSPYEKSILDFWYAQADTNSIDGSWLVSNTVPVDALEDTVQDIINESATNLSWSLSSSNYAELVNHNINLIFSTNEVDYVFTKWLTTNTYVKVESDPVFTNWLATNTVNQSELYLDDNSQSFTAAAGFEVVTNLSTSYSDGWITTSSNMIPLVTKIYHVAVSASFASSVVNVLADGHFFTNGVEVARIGWSRKIATVGDQGSAAGSGLIEIPAGTTCTMRIDVDKSATLSFDHFSFLIRE